MLHRTIRGVATLAKTSNWRKIVTDLESYKSSIRRRGYEVEGFESLSQLSSELSKLNKDKMQIGKERNTKVKMGKSITEKDKELLKTYKAQLKTCDTKISEVSAKIDKICSEVPNLLAPGTKDEEIEVVEYLNFPEPHGKSDVDLQTKIVDSSFKIDTNRDHKQIGEKLGLLEFQQASKITGSSWYYLMHDAALMEHALVQYALQVAQEHGFQVCSPPSIVKQEISEACGFKPKDQNNEQQIYHLEGSNNNLVLTGTAEIPFAALYANSVLKRVPKHIVGSSRCYRAEAGARGRDTRGLYRVHEFTKVEMFTWCDIHSSEAEFKKIVEVQKQILGDLGLTCRVINIPANDLGAPAYKKYDVEAWMPSRGWGELSSTSICTDYQSTKFNTKYVEDGKQLYAHTLNGTAMAVPRVIVAIIENFYDPKTNTITIPEVLRSFMGKSEMRKAEF